MTTTSYMTYRTLRDQVPAFAGAAAWRSGPPSVVINGDQVAADTQLVSRNYFEVLGAAPRIGRGIRSSDDSDAPTAAVVSHGFWTSVYRSDPAILGRRLTVAGIEYTITGVMPRGFSGHSAASTDLWLPIATAMRGDPGWDTEPRNVVSVLARLNAGASLVTAQQQATAALDREVALNELAGTQMTATTRRVAFWLVAVSLTVLAIGLANAATLLLVRAARRRRDVAIRTALGAARSQLGLEVIVDGAIMASAAVAVSLAMGYWMDEAIRRILLPEVSANAGLPARTMLAAFAAGLIAAIVAAAAGSSALRSAAAPAGIETRTSAGPAKLQKSLLVAQTAVCVALLAGAGIFARSLQHLLQQDFGMRLQDVLLVDFEEGAGEPADRDAIFTTALDKIKTLPGVALATPYQSLPFSGHHVPPISVPGRSEPPNMGGQLPYLIAATPELFNVLDIRLVDGRLFTAADDPRHFVAIVNESMARAAWPGERAVGKCIRAGFDPTWDPETATGPPTPSSALPCREVVGVVHDIRQRQVVPLGNEDRLLQYYVPFSQVPGPPARFEAGPKFRGLLVRTAPDAALIGPIRRLVTSGRSDLPFLRVRPYVDLLERQVQPWRLGSALLAVFSGLALAVAVIGIFAAFAHRVLARRREMAIRIAVGARPDSVAMMVLREAVWLAAFGIGLGAVLAFAGGRSLQSILYGIDAADPAAFIGAVCVMLAVVLAATIVPARRASQADPNLLLRSE
jgi:predicted permease